MGLSVLSGEESMLMAEQYRKEAWRKDELRRQRADTSTELRAEPESGTSGRGGNTSGR